MPVIPDSRGLIFGVRLGSGGLLGELGLADVDLTTIDAGTLLWLHVNLSDTRATQWIASCPQIPEPAREMLLGLERQARIERAGEGLTGVLSDLYHGYRADPEEVGFLQFYLDARLVVTGRRHPLMAMDRLRRQLREPEAPGSAAEVLLAILSAIERDFHTAVTALALAIDDLDDALLANRIRTEHGQLGQQRRLMARLRRYLSANRQAMTASLQRPPVWLRPNDQAELRQLLESLDGLTQDLELTQERARLINEELTTRVGQATNDNLYVLSIITAIFLPITLITGIFGMNVGGLPWVNSASGFLWVLGVMVITIAVTFLVLHWRRLF